MERGWSVPGLAAVWTSRRSIVVRDGTGKVAPGSGDSVDPGNMEEHSPCLSLR